MTPQTAARPTIDGADLRTELLGRLGLPADATDADVAAARRSAKALLDHAPDDQKAWATEQLADVEAVASLLDDLGVPARAAAPTPALAAKRTYRRPSRVVIGVVAAALIVGVAFGLHTMNSSSIPGITGTPTTNPSASASANALDMAKVSALMQKITSNPKDTASLAQLSDIYFQAGDYKNSAVFSQKVLAVTPKDDMAWVALGAAQFNQSLQSDAKTSWTKAIFLNPKNAEAHYDLGFLYLSGDKPDNAAAKKEWATVIAIDPKSDLAKTVQTHLASLNSASPAPSASSGS